MHDALEADFIFAVGYETEERGDVFDVRLLEEAQAAGDAKRDAAPGEFHLDLQALEVRAVENCHFLQLYPLFIAKLKHALSDECGLSGGIF